MVVASQDFLDRCSPQAWGWTVRLRLPTEYDPVFPTGVGMNRPIGLTHFTSSRVPHRRGDEPAWALTEITEKGCSPQAWG